MFEHETYWALVGGAAPIVVLATTVATADAARQVSRWVVFGDHRRQRQRFFEWLGAIAGFYIAITAASALLVFLAIATLDTLVLIFACESLAQQHDWASRAAATTMVTTSLVLVFVEIILSAFASMLVEQLETVDHSTSGE